MDVATGLYLGLALMTVDSAIAVTLAHIPYVRRLRAREVKRREFKCQERDYERDLIDLMCRGRADLRQWDDYYHHHL